VENYVIFKGTSKGIVILLDCEVSFDIIKEQLKNKVIDASKFFNGSKSNIFFEGRQLTDEEENECLDIIVKQSNINITFVNGKEEAVEKVLSPDKKLDDCTVPTKYYYGSVRSGQSVEYEGSIVVLGDVNPGGVIIAQGNIIVLGTLKGNAFAGSTGRRDVFVFALKMEPVQIRIADIITYLPESMLKERVKIPKYAYIVDEDICVDKINTKKLKSL